MTAQPSSRGGRGDPEFFDQQPDDALKRGAAGGDVHLPHRERVVEVPEVGMGAVEGGDAGMPVEGDDLRVGGEDVVEVQAGRDRLGALVLDQLKEMQDLQGQSMRAR